MLRDIKRRQRRWAAARGIDVDRHGYLADVDRNFYLPLSDAFAAALEDAGGGELADQRHRPAKIRALHSSAVLAINVFQYWENRRIDALPKALGFDGVLERVEIERRFPSGLRGMPPTLDVVLTLADKRLVAIESKFTEWMTKKRPKLAAFADKYLRSGRELWAEAGLPQCQALAADIADGAESFRQLDALQLLKHALGLAVGAGAPFSLLCLYYEPTGPSETSHRHRTEMARFSERADPRLGFRAMSYQTLFSNLRGSPDVDTDWLDYLESRYFAQGSTA